MQAKREYRDRDGAEVSVLDALVGRHEEGMTVFELRSVTDLDIDRIETALGQLKGAGLIRVEESGGRTLIYPHPRVVPDPGEDDEDPSLVERMLDRLPF
jgi:DNA-binding transcriptional ArsR family regulator